MRGNSLVILCVYLHSPGHGLVDLILQSLHLCIHARVAVLPDRMVTRRSERQERRHMLVFYRLIDSEVWIILF